MRHLLLLLSLALTTPLAHAASLAGVTLPDSATVGGKTLPLNGIGLREKVVIDVYVGGLYLPAKTTNASKAIGDDVPKRIHMVFIYNTVPADKQIGAYKEGFAKDPKAASIAAQATQLYAMMETVRSGDEMILDYVPGTGTTVTIKGKNKGTIAGADFMRALWRVYLGESPPTGALKKGMLGL